MLLNNRKYYNTGEGGGTPNPEENPQFVQLRNNYEQMKTDLATLKTNHEVTIAENAKLKEAQTTAERAKLDEIERLKLEKADVETKLAENANVLAEKTRLETQLAEYQAVLQGNYNNVVESLPKEHQERFKLLTFTEGDLNGSLKKASEFIEIFKASIKVDSTGSGTPPITPGTGVSSDGKPIVFNPNISADDAFPRTAK